LAESWESIPLPWICERALAFSVPRDDNILIVSSEGMHLLHIGKSVTVETDDSQCERDRYNSAAGVCQYKGREWTMLGLYGGNPLLTSSRGEWLELDVAANTLSVFLGGEQVWSTNFGSFSGDWAAATFSPDGRFIVLGCPYGFDFRIWERKSS
jgi:hypothetical protein